MRRIFVDAALEYAARGWPVFPCTPRSKVPLFPNPHPRGSTERHTCRGYRECGRLGHGVRDATTDPELITGPMWGRYPTANIGLACGLPGPDVVDFDTAHGKPGLATLARLRDTGLLDGARAVVATPSGGLHLYFAGSLAGQGNGALSRYGVDFRGTGGYVVAPPSVTRTGAYGLLVLRPYGGEVDFTAIRRYLCPPAPEHRRYDHDGDCTALVRWVGGQREGNRNNALYWAACRAIESGADEEVLAELVDAAVGTGLSSWEAERTVASARGKLAASGSGARIIEVDADRQRLRGHEPSDGRVPPVRQRA